jgi:ABC-2 type transport system permease protein
VFATLKKELLLLLRDPAGLLLLLIMPAALIIVMAVVQDAPYRDYQEMKFEIVVANKDKGTVGHKIIKGLQQNKSFVIVAEKNNKSIDENELKKLLQSGKYQMGIIIPENASAVLINASNSLSNQMAIAIGLTSALPVNAHMKPSDIQLLFDPVVKPSFRNALSFALNQYITQVKTDILMQRMSSMNGGSAESTVDMSAFNILNIQEQSLQSEMPISAQMNSVQHNVPAWAIFGMFLIVVPISGNMIRERDEGSAVRIQLIPDATKWVGLGKIVFNILVCMLQFFVMLLVGMLVLPWFGLPRLQLGPEPWLLIPMAFAIAFAAVNYGYFIGSLFKTANQAMPFGAISVVLFAAIGGVWVPLEILPLSMQRLANVSPLHWGLYGINEVILRGGGLYNIVLPFLVLILSGVMLGITPVFLAKK